MKIETHLSDYLLSPRRYWLLGGVLLFVLFSMIGLKNMGLASDYKIFFNEDDQDLKTLERMQSTYTTTDNIFIMLKPNQGSIYNKETLHLVHELTHALWRTPHVSRVDSLSNFPYSSATQETISVEEFIALDDKLTPERITFIADKASKERDLVNTLVTEDGLYTAINATILLPGNNHKTEILEVTEAVNTLITQYQQNYPEHDFFVTGIVMMNGAFFKAAKKDFITLIPLMMLFVLIAAGLILGSLSAAGSILVVTLLSLLGSLGLAGWLGIQLSAPSVSAPIIMFTVIIASSIHIISYMRRQVNKGITQEQAVLQSYQHNMKPIMVSHLTTIIGFLSMNYSDSPPFRDLGNIVALGVLFSLLLSFTILPYFLLKLKLTPKKSASSFIFRKVDYLSEQVIRYQRVILFSLIPTSLLLMGLSSLNYLNDDLIKYFDESVKFRADSEIVNDHFSGLSNIDYSISSNQENGIFHKDYLSFVEHFETWLLTQPKVVTTSSPLHRIKDLNRLMQGGNQQFYRLPDNAAMAAQNFLLYEMSVPFGKDVNNQISFDKSSFKLTVRLNNMSSQEIIVFENKVNTWLQINKPDSITVDHSSPALIFAHIGQSSTVSLLKGAFMALILVSLALILIFRSFYIGLLSLIPNLLPLGAAFGAWYLLQGHISMGLAGVSAMVIGIVVDDTVHFLYQYTNALKNGLSPEESIKTTFSNTMSAIVISSLLLIVGFLLLTTSSFEKNAQMGLLTSITIILALLFDSLLLPALALRFLRKIPKPYIRKQNITLKNNI